MSHGYGLTSSINELTQNNNITITHNSVSQNITIKLKDERLQKFNYTVINMSGELVLKSSLKKNEHSFSLINIPSGVYIVTINDGQKIIERDKFFLENKFRWFF